MATTPREDAEALAAFFRTITPASDAEQKSLDLLNGDPEKWIANAIAVNDTLVEQAASEGTVTTYDLFTPERLANAGKTRRRNT